MTLLKLWFAAPVVASTLYVLWGWSRQRPKHRGVVNDPAVIRAARLREHRIARHVADTTKGAR